MLHTLVTMIICRKDYSDSGWKFRGEFISPCSTLNYMFQEVSENSKGYIRMGEECSICMESITSKINAWKTKCGHIFHKTCLIRYSNTALSKNFCCPCCRGEMEDFDNWTSDVYYGICYSPKNHLDQIHYFELYQQMIQNICEECDNIIGCTKRCFGCKDWRWSPSLNAISRPKSTNKTSNE